MKKVLFIRGISVLPEDSIYRRIFVARLIRYGENKGLARENEFSSPIFDIIRVSDLFGLY